MERMHPLFGLPLWLLALNEVKTQLNIVPSVALSQSGSKAAGVSRQAIPRCTG